MGDTHSLLGITRRGWGLAAGPSRSPGGWWGVPGLFLGKEVTSESWPRPAPVGALQALGGLRLDSRRPPRCCP